MTISAALTAPASNPAWNGSAASSAPTAAQLKSSIEKFMMDTDFGHDFEAVPNKSAPCTKGRQAITLDKEYAFFLKDGTSIDYPIRKAHVDAQAGNFYVSVQGQYEAMPNPVHWFGPFNLSNG